MPHPSYENGAGKTDTSYLQVHAVPRLSSGTQQDEYVARKTVFIALNNH
jgi:hypothetical protein